MKRWGTAVLLTLAYALAGAQGVPSAEEQQRIARELNWLPAGATGQLGNQAVFKASKTYTFLNSADTDKFLQLNGNPPQHNSVTISPTEGSWFGILRFSPEGYVKDDETIDGDALLKSLKENNVLANEEKRKQGWPTLAIQGWALPPHYDREAQRLEWGTLLKAEDGQTVVNVSTRILGRSGYTSAILVTSADTMNHDLADFKKALKDFDYVSGERYTEWREGDKVAAYGLGALVLGGAAAVATSKGGFKAIGLAIAGAVAALWAGAKRVLGRRKS